jgi:hypothetical protein
MLLGYAIAIATVGGQRRRCGVAIALDPSIVEQYVRNEALHVATVADALPEGYTLVWCSEWRRGTYTREEPLWGG